MDPVSVLQLLSAQSLPAPALLARLGGSAAELETALAVLAEEGIRISTQPSLTLEEPAGFGPHVLRWRLGRAVEYHPRCDSTNRLGRLAARDWQSGPGPLVVADYQTAGRGRLSRRWSSRSGQNLLFSLCLALPLPPERAGRGPLVWGAAMAEVLDVELKWPNDLVTGDGRKLGGMLIELIEAPEPGRPLRMVLGVGININQTHFEDLPLACSLRQLHGRFTDRAALLADLVRAVEAAQPGAEGALDRWRARSNTLGRRVRIGAVEGVASDIREDGALMVGGQAVLAGDVSLIH